MLNIKILLFKILLVFIITVKVTVCLEGCSLFKYFFPSKLIKENLNFFFYFTLK